MVLVAGYGGLRFGELADLRGSRVDLPRGRLLVAETLVDVNRTAVVRSDENPPREAHGPTAAFCQPLRRAGFRRNWC